jgi:hypothetical protein
LIATKWRVLPTAPAPSNPQAKEGGAGETSALLDDLRTIGNRAAHGDDGASFTVAEALRFGKLTDDVIAIVRALE